MCDVCHRWNIELRGLSIGKDLKYKSDLDVQKVTRRNVVQHRLFGDMSAFDSPDFKG